MSAAPAVLAGTRTPVDRRRVSASIGRLSIWQPVWSGVTYPAELWTEAVSGC